MEMEALRAKVAVLEAEVARLKETRAAFYKMYLESEGKHSLNSVYHLDRDEVGECFSRVKF